MNVAGGRVMPVNQAGESFIQTTVPIISYFGTMSRGFVLQIRATEKANPMFALCRNTTLRRKCISSMHRTTRPHGCCKVEDLRARIPRVQPPGARTVGGIATLVPPGGRRDDEDRGRDVNIQTGTSLGACIGISRGLPPCGVRVTGLLISRHPGYVVLSSICSRLICGGCCISQHPTTVRNLANSDRRMPDTLLAILCHFAVCGDTVPGSGGLRIWRGSSSLVTMNHVEG